MHRFSITETGLLCLARLERDAAHNAGMLLAGRPVEYKQIELVDDAGRPVPIGEPGDLVVKSPYIAEGYCRQGRFADDPSVPGQRVYRTGDLARFQPAGR